ncbi:MAG: hypothetical protein ACK4UN_08495 [Limisphaerales bacterium]
MEILHIKRIGLLLATQWVCLFLFMIVGRLSDAESLQFIGIMGLVSSFLVPVVGYSYVLSDLPAFSKKSGLIKGSAVIALALLMALAGYFVAFAVLWKIGGPVIPSDDCRIV